MDTLTQIKLDIARTEHELKLLSNKTPYFLEMRLEAHRLEQIRSPGAQQAARDKLALCFRHVNAVDECSQRLAGLKMQRAAAQAEAEAMTC